MNQEYIPRIAMSIHADPDDQEFSVGGTLAKWARAGCEIISVIITSGDAGSNDPAKDGNYKKELAVLREQEQLAANAILGIRETVFLGYPDGELEPTMRPGPRHKNLARSSPTIRVAIPFFGCNWGAIARLRCRQQQRSRRIYP